MSITERKYINKGINLYFKKIVSCRACKREFGSDLKQDDGLCPICYSKLLKRGSMLIKDHNYRKRKNDTNNS